MKNRLALGEFVFVAVETLLYIGYLSLGGDNSFGLFPGQSVLRLTDQLFPFETTLLRDNFPLS